MVYTLQHIGFFRTGTIAVSKHINRSRPRGIILLSIIALIIAIFLASLWVLVPAWYGLPPIAARRKRIERALQMVNLQPDEIFYDLGSGHGRVLIIAAKDFGANAIGIEAGPIQCLVAWINARVNGISSKVRIEAGDFYRADLSRADVVYAYLTSQYATRLQKHLKSQLKSGARIVTVSFNFPDWEPIEVDLEHLIFLYRVS